MAINIPNMNNPTQITHNDIQDGVLTLSPSQLSTNTARQIRVLNCNVKVVISGLSEDMTTLPKRLFVNCRNITFVALPAGLTTIGEAAFYECTSLTQLTLPASLTTIGRTAFFRCTSLTQLTLPAGLTKIGNWAFQQCTSLTQVSLPARLNTIGIQAFSDCASLTQVTLPARLTTIGNYAFQRCTSLTQLTLPVGLTTIGRGAFWDCTSLIQLTLPVGLTTIGGYPFYGCTSLTQLTLPDSITDICSNTFDGFFPNDLTIAITSTDEQAFDRVIAQIPANYRGRVIAFTVTAPQEQYRQDLLKELFAEVLYSLTSTFKVCYVPLTCTSKYFHPEDRYDLQSMNHGVNEGISFSNQVFGTASLAGHINSFVGGDSEVVELRANIYQMLYQVPLLNDDDALNQFKQSINKVVTAQFPDHADAILAKIWPWCSSR